MTNRRGANVPASLQKKVTFAEAATSELASAPSQNKALSVARQVGSLRKPLPESLEVSMDATEELNNNSLFENKDINLMMRLGAKSEIKSIQDKK